MAAPVVIQQTSSVWFVRLSSSPLVQLRLFCFPHAGGGVLDFRRWPNHFSDQTEVWAVQLPGRGKRSKEPPSRRLSHVVNEIAGAMRPFLDVPFAFFGHSLGAITGFEVARRIRGDLNLQPRHLFVAGSSAPQIPYRGRLSHKLPDDQLLSELRSMNRTPAAVLESPELMALMLPVIRADLEMLETYGYKVEPPLACSISAFGGLQDPMVEHRHVAAWREHTTGNFRLRFFAGDHFFVHQAEPLVLHDVAAALNQCCPR